MRVAPSSSDGAARTGPMIASFFRGNRVLLVGMLLAVLVLYKACDNGGGDVRFRLAFAVSVDGAVKTGSSIINVLFYGGGGTRSGSPYRYYTLAEGVAPVIDLGSYGWLVAAMEYDGEEYYRRKRLYRLACAVPRMATGLLDAFGLEVS